MLKKTALSGLAALVISYSANVGYSYELEQKTFSEMSSEEGKDDDKKESLQDLANTLYEKMAKKEGIMYLFFEKYGGNHKGFYVEKNHPSEDKYIVLNAEDHNTDENGGMKKLTIKLDRDLKDILSATLKKYNNKGEIQEERSISTNDKDVAIVYKRILEASVEYIDKAKVHQGSIVNSATYKELVKDEKFVSAFKNIR